MTPADERLAFTLAVRGGLTPSVTDDGRSVAFVDATGASLLTYSGLIAFDADGVLLPAAFEVGASMAAGSVESIVLRVDDRHARYPITIDPIAQQGYFKASNTGIDDLFGLSVAIDGDTLVVGASGESSNATGVNGNQADNSADGAGAAYVFVRSGTAWVQQAYLKASNTNANDIFGRSVAISGDTIVVGADGEDSNATGVNGNQSDNSLTNPGAAYVFVRTGTTWSQQAYLKASNTGQFDFFGFSVAISGETIVVGAMGEDSAADGINGNQADNSALTAGAAYVFVRSGTTWSQQAYLKASNSEGGDNFGDSVSISGNTIVVGANLEDSAATGINGNQASNAVGGSGAAYVFVRSGTAWTQQAYVKASNTGGADQFGASVAISGDTMVVGAFSEASGATGVNGNQADNSASGSGAAYVFVRSGTTWSQQAYLKASNTDAGDSFGGEVAISGDIVVAGATWESSNAAGVNGNQSDDSLFSAGAAYVFGRTGSTWSQLAYLKASNPGAQDGFGGALAVSGGTVIVGAASEDSNATGVNGVQGNNAASSAGAAYLFYIPPSLDCNGNGIPDEAELAGNDCNNNGVPDDCEPGVTCCQGDLNGDGKIDGADLTLLLSAWGFCP
ncbi:MAG: integrin [Phycisphaerae bacterium]|nr:integrin [Phycisphaerae bacterium]